MSDWRKGSAFFIHTLARMTPEESLFWSLVCSTQLQLYYEFFGYSDWSRPTHSAAIFTF
jgi:hypothetical protein